MNLAWHYSLLSAVKLFDTKKTNIKLKIKQFSTVAYYIKHSQNELTL